MGDRQSCLSNDHRRVRKPDDESRDEDHHGDFFACHFVQFASVLIQVVQRLPKFGFQLRVLIACAVFLSTVLPVLGGASDVVTTYCRETEVALDATHSSAKLEGCSDDAPVDLLWHLDRIDQLDSNLDGRYHRRHSG